MKLIGYYFVLFLIACQGQIGDPSQNGKNGLNPNSANGSIAKFDTGPVYLRRLAYREYNNIIRDVFTIDATSLVANFPIESNAKSANFDNAAGAQTISLAHVQRFLDAAKDIAKQVIATPTKRNAIVGCDPTTNMRASCIQNMVKTLGKRLYRQPLTDEEVDALYRLSEKETDPNEGVARVIEALLQSPKFLFRVEIGTKEQPIAGFIKLTGYEIATRLSFMLYGSVPDTALLDDASAGKLDSPEGIETAVRRMIKDARTKETVQSFLSQWFQLKQLDTARRSTTTFPSFGPELISSMKNEMAALFDQVTWADKANFLELYTVNYGFADKLLAPIYGVSSNSSTVQKVSFANVANRGGLFTTAAFATLSSRNDNTSAIVRGKYVRDAILCDTLPAPIAGITPPTPQPGESAEAAEERHTADPQCASCHVRIDPIGHGLERYDAIGQIRTTYADGKPVKTTGTVSGLPQPNFSGGVELGKLAAGSEMGQSCVVKHLLRWTLGRPENIEPQSDAFTLNQLNTAFKAANFNLPELIVKIATSDSFRLRRANNGGT